MKRWTTVAIIVMLVGMANACGNSAASDESAQLKMAANNSESEGASDTTLSENEFAQLMLSIGTYCGDFACVQNKSKKTLSCTSSSLSKGGTMSLGTSGMIEDDFVCTDWDVASLKTKEFCGQKFIDSEKEYSENVQFTIHSVYKYCKETGGNGAVEANKALMSSEQVVWQDLIKKIFCKNFDALLNDGQ